VEVDNGPYASMLAGIRGLRLHVVDVDAKFKYDDQKPADHRERISDELDRRGVGLDVRAAAQQRRRLGDTDQDQSGRS
jgi:transcriptional regulator